MMLRFPPCAPDLHDIQLSTSNLIAYSESGIIKDICLSTITKRGQQQLLLHVSLIPVLGQALSYYILTTPENSLDAAFLQPDSIFESVRSSHIWPTPATSTIHRNLLNSRNNFFYRLAIAIPKWVPNRLHCPLCIKHIISSIFPIILTHLAALLQEPHSEYTMRCWGRRRYRGKRKYGAQKCGRMGVLP